MAARKKTTTPDTSTSVLESLGNALVKLSTVVEQQWEMLKEMKSRMDGTQKDSDAIVPLNENNVATRDDPTMEEPEIINKVFYIMYVTEKPKSVRGQNPDALSMMKTVDEPTRLPNGSMVQATKYFDTEEQAQKYIDYLKQKGINLLEPKILSRYI